MLGMWLARPHLPTPIMKSIASTSFRDPDNVVVCQTAVPQFQSASDILVRVRAASLNRIDRRIAFGYGRTLRRMIRTYNSTYDPELPLVLGRSCAGIVDALGFSEIYSLFTTKNCVKRADAISHVANALDDSDRGRENNRSRCV